MAKFMERLKALVPQIKANPQVKAFPGTPGEKPLNVVAGEAGAFAQKKDFSNANELLDLVESLLKSATAPASATGKPGEKPDFPRLWKAARTTWQTASELVDGQFTKLQGVLKQSNDPELQQIAEFGLNAITAGHKVQLLTAIREVDQSTGGKLVDAAIDAQGVIEEFLDHLESDERVQACDGNSFGVPMSVHSTLSTALGQLDAALDAVEA
jgi:hypothetical protein